MTDHPRARKIADRIKVIVAETIERRVKDPRLGFVTVTDVRVTGDLQHASIFYTVFGSDEERAGTAAALESAKGVIRREVGAGTGLRLTPSIEFIADAMPENAAHIDDLLRQAADARRRGRGPGQRQGVRRRGGPVQEAARGRRGRRRRRRGLTPVPSDAARSPRPAVACGANVGRLHGGSADRCGLGQQHRAGRSTRRLRGSRRGSQRSATAPTATTAAPVRIAGFRPSA